MTEDSGLPADVVAAIKANRKIEAIKLLREHRGIGLKESKEIVDDYLAGLPPGSIRPAPRTDSGGARLLLVGVIIAAAFFAYRYFS